MADLNEWYGITPAGGAGAIAPGQGPQPTNYNAPGVTNVGGTLSGNVNASGSVILAVVLLGGVLLLLHARE